MKRRKVEKETYDAPVDPIILEKLSEIVQKFKIEQSEPILNALQRISVHIAMETDFDVIGLPDKETKVCLQRVTKSANQFKAALAQMPHARGWNNADIDKTMWHVDYWANKAERETAYIKEKSQPGPKADKMLETLVWELADAHFKINNSAPKVSKQNENAMKLGAFGDLVRMVAEQFKLELSTSLHASTVHDHIKKWKRARKIS